MYDHDLPEFPFCIEIYGEKLYVAEYKRRHNMPDEEHDIWMEKSIEVIAEVLSVKKEKCVSDIMREAFQLLSYWPLDHHHGLVTTENEQQIHHSHINMDEHLMF